MSLQRTNLVVSSTPLQEDFRGDAQSLFAAMVARLKILSPTGTALFQTGDVEPIGNQGPWLKNGTSWWVYSESTGRYVPADISDSSLLPYFIQGAEPSAPGEDDPEVWLKTQSGRIVGLYGWSGSAWLRASLPPNSGITSGRPADPQDLEQYFDTSINVLIHFERGMWRTVAGSPGDVKFSVGGLLTDVLSVSPGWAYIGENDQTVRGRVLGVATKDISGTSSVYAPDSGLSQRAAGDLAGAETVVLDSTNIEQHTHVIGHAEALNFDNNVYFHRADDGETIEVPPPSPPNQYFVKGDGTANGSSAGNAGDGPVGTSLLTSRQLSLADQPNYTGVAIAHENMQPTSFLWCVVKL